MYQEVDNKCPGCNERVRLDKIKKHIQGCQRYRATVYKDILHIQRDIPMNVLHFLKGQLQLSLQTVKDLIAQKSPPKKVEPMQEEDFSDILDIDEIEEESMAIKKGSGIEVKMQMAFYGANMVVCKGCDRKYYETFDRDMLFSVFGCWHIFCVLCVNRYIDNEFVNQEANLKCLEKGCSQIIEADQISGMIGKQKFELLYAKAIRKMCKLVQCFKCHTEFQFAEGNAKDAPKKDNNGNVVKPEQAKDYAVNRYICPTSSCKTEQCKTCQASPYHLGMTCKQFKDRSLLKKCRYCDEPLNQKNFMAYKPEDKTLSDICKNAECQQSAKLACRKMLSCKHPCNGFKGEKECLPCLNEICASNNKALNGVNGDQYCAICYVESLSSAPCIRSSCGHIFHVKCLKKRFQIKWLTPRIFFNFCTCPLCKKWINVVPESELHQFTQQYQVLYDKIQKMASDRLKFEQLQKSDPKLKDKTSPYFGKPHQYAMIIYAYFMCFKCKKPYFGGRKDCMAAMNQQNAGGSFKAEELICPNCCQIPVENCPKHGTDFIQFKCKFCCNIAQWFCWGNTHFCEPCHKKQVEGDYVSKYTKAQLPQCKGSGVCPIGGNHSGNGQQKMLGCAICRNYKQNHKGF